MIRKSGYWFSEKDHAPPKIQNAMADEAIALHGTSVASERLKSPLFAGPALLAFDEKLGESLEIARLGRLRRPRLEVVALERGGYERRTAEKPARFGNVEAREPGGFQESRLAVGGFDQLFQLRRRFRRQAEAAMDRSEQTPLDGLVGVADHRFERRDHVADHVFGRVVQQHGKPSAAIQARSAPVGQRLDQERVLRDGENMRAARLSVPARYAREPMRDILDLDIERRRVEQIEPPA